MLVKLYSLLHALSLYKTLEFSLLPHKKGSDSVDFVHLHLRAAVLYDEAFQYKKIHEDILEKTNEHCFLCNCCNHICPTVPTVLYLLQPRIVLTNMSGL